ncbi:uncharacterized protein LOC122532808 isoform X2 [Frieseomelitta varia]|nr:uncharacterized protein LOC122532808 isoform X2 [Frieseomelitta varia]
MKYCYVTEVLKIRRLFLKIVSFQSAANMMYMKVSFTTFNIYHSLCAPVYGSVKLLIMSILPANYRFTEGLACLMERSSLRGIMEQFTITADD